MRIILLRGLARESGHWLEFPTLLQKKLGDTCAVNGIDFPGCGKYYRDTALKSVTAMTDHARKESGLLIATPNAETKPIYVIGISMGGMIALDWAQRFPNELAGIVLINSSAGDQPLSWRLQPRAWLTILRALFLPVQQREALVLRMVSNQSIEYPQHTSQWLAIQKQHPVTRTTIIRMLSAAARFRPKTECKVNGLVLTSIGDRMVSEKASEDLAQRFNWPLIRHPTAGHDLPMDDSDWVVDKINAWITECSA